MTSCGKGEADSRWLDGTGVSASCRCQAPYSVGPGPEGQRPILEDTDLTTGNLCCLNHRLAPGASPDEGAPPKDEGDPASDESSGQAPGLGPSPSRESGDGWVNVWWKPLDLRIEGWLVPLPRRFVVLSAAFMVGIVLQVYGASPLICLPVLLAAALLRLVVGRLVRWPVILLPVALSAGYIYALCLEPRPGEHDISGYCGRDSITLVGRVLEVRDSGASARRIIVEVHDVLVPRRQCCTGKLCLTVLPGRQASSLPVQVRACAWVMAGAEVQVKARLQKLSLEASHREKQDYVRSLWREGMFCQAFTGEGRIRSVNPEGNKKPAQPDSGLWCWILRSPRLWREAITDFHRRCLGRTDGDLLSSMVLGEKAVSLDQHTLQLFRTAGLSHVLAASGFNLTIVTGTLWFIARLIFRLRLISSLICMAGTVVFVAMAGVSASILRAALMGFVVIAVRCGGRSVYLPSALAAAGLLSCLLEPGCVADVGFQLSYAATSGMILMVPVMDELIPDRVSRPARVALEAACACLAAQMAVLPLQLAYFYEFGSYFLPANLLVGPAVAPITVAGFASSLMCLSGLPALVQIASTVDWLAHFGLAYITAVVSALCHLPAARLTVGEPHSWSIVLAYASMLGGALAFRWRRGRALTLFFIAGCLACLFVRLPLEQELHVKAGKATLTVLRNRTALCTGDPDNPRFRRVLAQYAARLDRSVHQPVEPGRATKPGL